jgi:hypothetical protein
MPCGLWVLHLKLEPKNYRRNIPALAYTSIVTNGASYVAILFDLSNKEVSRIYEDLTKMDNYLISAYLPQLMIGGSDTIYLSKDYWEGASESDRFLFKIFQAMKFPEMIFPSWGKMSGVNVEGRMTL